MNSQKSTFFSRIFGEKTENSDQQVQLASGVPIEFVHIPAGEFLMGSDSKKDRHAFDDELPQHIVYLSEYWMGKSPVTNRQFDAFVQATGYLTTAEKAEKGFRWVGEDIEVKGACWRHPFGPGSNLRNKENHPVMFVSWSDAQAFCGWLSQKSGKAFRLPSEAEWEKAARGMDERIYPWGNQIPTLTLCNFNDMIGGTTPVGTYDSAGNSPYGCTNMAGNIWQWCADWKDSYSDSRRENPVGPSTGTLRVLRGGCWSSPGYGVRSAFRGCGNDEKVYDYQSFRCCHP